jgi:nitroreductase
VSGTFIRENYPQLSFSEEELQRKKVGILGTMFPPAWQDPAKLEEAIQKSGSASLGRPIQTSPVLLIVVYDPSRRAPASEGDFLGIISLGCATENMWLMAQSLGIGFHIVSSIGGGPVESEVKRILNIPESLKIVYGIRLGYPVAGPSKYLRVRREVEDFTHYNRFGNKGILPV